MIDVINPATGELLATVPDSTAEEVNAAVAAARASFADKRWRGLDPVRRERILWDIGEAIARHRAELARTISLETGKTLREAAGADAGPAADCFRYYSGWVRKLHGETIPVDAGLFNYTLREPVGVVGAIVPWNFPLSIAAWKIAPALACGCSVVLKPSELTPLNALRLGEICREAGLPEGVLTVVTGYGPTAGEVLALNEDVDKISFTGSIATARRLLAASSVSNLKRLSVELGGKSPFLVFLDADLDAAVKAALWGIFLNKGEVCTAASRLLLHEAIHDRFLEELVARAQTAAGRSTGPGDPDGAADLRPADGSRAGLHRKRQTRGRATAHRRRARYRGREGARLLRQAHGVQRRDSGDAHRPGRNLRPRAVRDPFSRRGRGDRDRERHRVRSRLLGVDARYLSRAPYRRGDPGRHRVGEHVQQVRFRVAARRLPAERLRARPWCGGARTVHQREVGVGGAVVPW
jgi:acyl-CoA reductase-like NAD-dependent aldehyde dehydrogenase